MIQKKHLIAIYSFTFGVMTLTSAAIWPLSKILSVINFCITVTLAFILYAIFKNYSGYLLNCAQQIRGLAKNGTKHLFDSMPIALAISDENDIDRIIFCNSLFQTTFEDEAHNLENSLSFYLANNSLENVISSGSAQVTYKNQKFKLYVKKIGSLIVFYFFDDSKYLSLKQKYEDAHICVGFVTFDNKEELRSCANDQEYSRISVDVENTLRKWMTGASGIFKKLSDGKYFIAFEEKFLNIFAADKFRIVNQIHNVKLDEHRYATISIGISAGAKTLSDASAQASSALNMSLGRGGDQVSVKIGNSYKFFGGSSQGLEKRSKVRSRVVAAAILEKIKSSDKIFIMGHKHSDFDSIGASAALWSVCTKFKNKISYVVLNKSESMASNAIAHLEKHGRDKMFISPMQAETLITPDSLLIVVDTHILDFMESTTVYNLSKNIIVIDHHRMNVNKIDDAIIFFHEPLASSACEMVTELIQYMDDECLKKPEAECLLAGIMLDTKNFSLKSGIRTFEAAAYLKKKGADSREVKKMFADSIETYKLKCSIISNAYVVKNCAIARLQQLQANARISCVQAADELLNIKNIKASFVFFTDGNKINISARSLGEINVQVIMEALGGGGHPTMAAAQIENVGFEKAESQLIEIIKEKTDTLNYEMGNK